jgi:hypothetical protein
MLLIWSTEAYNRLSSVNCTKILALWDPVDIMKTQETKGDVAKLSGEKERFKPEVGQRWKRWKLCSRAQFPLSGSREPQGPSWTYLHISCLD